MAFPSLLQDTHKMYDLTWWYLYTLIINERNERKKEQHDIVEALLPWINPELYSKVKEKEKTKTNVFYDKQMADIMSGNFNPEDDSIPNIDDAFDTVPFNVRQLFEDKEDNKHTIDPSQLPDI